MKKPILWTLTSFLLLVLALGITKMAELADRNEEHTILAIFAHPDDELMISAALSRFAREGHQVYLAIASDGRYGVTDRSGISAGDSLAEIRADEIRCSAEEMGINPPKLFGLADGFAHKNSDLEKTLEDFQLLHDKIYKLFEELNPDVVITWGPGGGYGHPDHRTVSNIVTEVFQRNSNYRPEELLYTGLSSDRFKTLPDFSQPLIHWFIGGWNTTNPEYLNVQIPYEDVDLQNARNSIGCHQSQFTTADMNELIDFLDYVYNGHISLRPWNNNKEAVVELLE